jgi:spore germination cell wall hydrolase CwlJ-like protein
MRNAHFVASGAPMEAMEQDQARAGRSARSLEFGAAGVALLLALLVLLGGFTALQRAGSSENPASGARRVGEAPPPVDPVLLRDVAPETAREINAAIPFADVANPPAASFRASPAAPGFNRAVDCLAAAAWYEAGDDAEGQRSVVQVVLNRVRHPAFPDSVCGVVFQGSERVTGCQFTFTCDGALRRIPSAAAWGRARTVARQALTGSVYRKVGVATHYHTDWVVPYWSDSLLKLTAVKTHLFFRWPGRWGGPGAQRARYAGYEPGVAKLAFLSPVHSVGDDGQALAGLDALDQPPGEFSLAGSGIQKILFRSDEAFLVLLKPGAVPDILPLAARGLCGDRDVCSVRAWSDPAAAPSQLPVPEAARTAMTFSYRRDRAQDFDKPLWNCTSVARTNPRECMKQAIPIERLAAAASGRPLTPLTSDDEPKRAAPADTTTKPAVAEATTGRRRPGT